MLDAFLLGLYVCGKHLLHLMKSMAKVSQTDVGIYQDQQRNSVGFDTLSWTHILIGCRVLTNCSKAPGFGIGTKDFVAGIGQWPEWGRTSPGCGFSRNKGVFIYIYIWQIATIPPVFKTASAYACIYVGGTVWMYVCMYAKLLSQACAYICTVIYHTYIRYIYPYMTTNCMLPLSNTFYPSEK